jgi:hypothetical protein
MGQPETELPAYVQHTGGFIENSALDDCNFAGVCMGGQLLQQLPAESATLKIRAEQQTDCGGGFVKVRHFRAAAEDRIDLLRQRAGGQWHFDRTGGDGDNEIGFKLGVERFTGGEYISVCKAGIMHTARWRWWKSPDTQDMLQMN